MPARSSKLTAATSGLSLGVLSGICGFHVARAGVVTEALFERHIGGPLELRKVEFSLLALLLAHAQLSPKQLAQTLAVTAPKLTALLDALQARGLLERQPNLLDGRSQWVVLTVTGRRLAQRAAAAAEPMEAAVRGRLSAAEHAMLIELLGKLSDLPAHV